MNHLAERLFKEEVIWRNIPAYNTLFSGILSAYNILFAKKFGQILKNFQPFQAIPSNCSSVSSFFDPISPPPP